MYFLGTKYKYARQWKMYCVTPHWFHDSVQSGYCMPEADYDVDSEADGGMEKGGDKAANDWKKKLDVFKLPTVADDEFLDGCKVRREFGGYELPSFCQLQNKLLTIWSDAVMCHQSIKNVV